MQMVEKEILRLKNRFRKKNVQKQNAPTGQVAFAIEP